MKLLPRQLHPLAAFTIIYLVMSGFAAWAGGNSEFLVYLSLLVLLSAVILKIHSKVNFPLALLVAFSIWGLAHMMGGIYIVSSTEDVLYNYFLIPGLLKYDQLIHAYGFGITTYACWICLKAIQPKVRSTAGPLSLALFASLGLGALNETIEFSLTLMLPKTNVGSFSNLGWDLVFNLLGALIAVTMIRDSSPKYSPDSIQPAEHQT